MNENEMLYKFGTIAKDHETKLNGFIQEKDKKSSLVLNVAVALILLALVASIISIVFVRDKCDCDCVCVIAIAIAIPLLTLIAGILCISVSKSAGVKADYYRDELIVLRDLYIAIDIADSIDFNNKREFTEKKADGTFAKTDITQKAKMQEQIIEKLLDRCDR